MITFKKFIGFRATEAERLALEKLPGSISGNIRLAVHEFCKQNDVLIEDPPYADGGDVPTADGEDSAG